MSRTVIISGPVRAGKTTAIERWCVGRSDTVGILQPVRRDGRHFLDIASQTSVPLEMVSNDQATEEVGRFRFSKAAFAWAEERLQIAAKDPEARFVLVDEIGPLELSGRGLDSVIRGTLAGISGILVLVVRETLVETVVAAYSIRDAAIVSAMEWPHVAQDLIDRP